jgi:signal transduction histidine kinase
MERLRVQDGPNGWRRSVANAPAHAHPAAVENAIRVLVVEDEPLVAMDLEGTLRELGYDVVARTGRAEEALRLAAALRPDVVLMDIGLAGPMDGIEAARRVRSDLAIPVVFMTGHADVATLAKARLSQPYGYIVKPFDAAAVRAQVETVHYRRLAEREREHAQRDREAGVRRDVERLQELNEMRSRFVSVASHELNTPLTPLLLSVSLLKQSLEGKVTATEAQSLAILGRNLERLASLVKDLLDAARLQSSRLPLSLAPTNLRLLADGVADTFRGRATERKVRIETHGTGLAEAMADANRVIQVLTNLVDNALKFTPAGGRVDLFVTAAGPNVQLEVKDTGRGLDAAQVAQLFQPFAMVHDLATTQGQGTGLGLYVSRGIAELHGGTLTCRSDGPGKGTSFMLTLPAAGPPSAPAPTRRRPPPPPPAKEAA